MHRDHVKIMEFQWCIGTVQVYRFSAGDGIHTLKPHFQIFTAKKAGKNEWLPCGVTFEIKTITFEIKPVSPTACVHAKSYVFQISVHIHASLLLPACMLLDLPHM